jgi:hypothetical protein
MLGTCTEASIYNEHVLQKAKKEIKRVNSLLKKVAKSAEKYVGSEITEAKEIEELKSILRTFQELTGDQEELPNTVAELLESAKGIEERWNEIVASGENMKATIFMRDSNGHPKISSHMILGNMKENIKIAVNNGDEIMKSKKSVSETLALDVKPIEFFLPASQDIIRAVVVNGAKVLPEGLGVERNKILDDGRVICERPISFERMGKRETAIALSEQLPEGTEFKTVLRIREKSPFDDMKLLHRVFSFGKNNGLGSWRGSGNYGAYVFKLEPLEDYTETFADGWQ